MFPYLLFVSESVPVISNFLLADNRKKSTASIFPAKFTKLCFADKSILLPKIVPLFLRLSVLKYVKSLPAITPLLCNEATFPLISFAEITAP